MVGAQYVAKGVKLVGRCEIYLTNVPNGEQHEPVKLEMEGIHENFQRRIG